MPARCFRVALLMGCLFVHSSAFAQSNRSTTASSPGNPTLAAIQFAQQHALPESLTPGKDRTTKARLIAAMAGKTEVPIDLIADLFDPAALKKLVGTNRALTVADLERLTSTPNSRTQLNEKVRHHCDLLSTQFDMIDDVHHASAEKLVGWIVQKLQTDKPLSLIVICTGNTRRSMLGATMGNVAASYYGLANLRFHSGGTDPGAFNPRTIRTLREIGIEIESTGKEATRGTAGEANPVYRVRWGAEKMEAIEFSKKYTDPANPQTDFAALLVCSEADASCPRVVGADSRIPVPYLDPKAFDGASFEAAKYAERRDDIGRFMLSVMMQARRRLEIQGKRK